MQNICILDLEKPWIVKAVDLNLNQKILQLKIENFKEKL